MLKGLRSCVAALGASAATLVGGVVGTVLLSDRFQQVCMGISSSIRGISSVASNTTTTLSALFNSLSAASATTSVLLSQASSGVSSTAHSTSAILTQLANAAGQVRPLLRGLNQTVFDLPVNADVLLNIPPISMPPLVIPSSTIPISVATNIAVPLANLITAETAGVLNSVATNGEQVSSLLTAVSDGIVTAGPEVGQLLTQLSNQLAVAGVEARQVGELVNEIGGQVSQLSEGVVVLPAFCSGVSLGLGLAVTLMAASVVGVIVYLCVRHVESPSVTRVGSQELEDVSILVDTDPPVSLFSRSR